MKNYLNKQELINKTREQFTTTPTAQEVDTYLTNITYFDLIKGYKNTNLKENNVFIPGLTIDMVYHIHWLNLSLSNILLKCSLEVEKHIKSSMSEIIMNYGETFEEYLEPRHYKNSSSSTLSRLNKDLNDDIDNYYYNYLSKNDYVPSWLLIQHSTLGRVINWYSILKPPHKLAVAKKFLKDPIDSFNLKDEESKKQLVKSFFDYILEMRNTTAHGNRILNIIISETLQESLLKKARINQYFKHNDKGIVISDITNFITIVILLTDIPLFAVNIVNELIFFFESNSQSGQNPMYDLGIDMYKLFNISNEDFDRLKGLLKDKFQLD
ncbi:MAG: Abi family protein [Latilactobacillus curvatus]